VADSYLAGTTGTYGAAMIRVGPLDGTASAGLIRFYVDAAAAKTAGDAFTPTERMRIGSDGNVGIGTTAPDKKLEINSATGDCLRLTYNDSNGSAAYYTDFAVSSAGILTITPSGAGITLADTKDILAGAAGGCDLGASGTGWGDVYLASGKVLKVNAVQVVSAQGAAVADATDAASVILRLNDLLARLRTHGLIAT
jgi:hypothetical protein